MIAPVKRLPRYFDINLPVMRNVLPVPIPNLPVHGNAAHYHVFPLIRQTLAVLEHFPGSGLPGFSGIAVLLHNPDTRDTVARRRPLDIPVNQNRLWVPCLQPLVKQAAHRSLSRPGKACKKI